MTTIRFARLRFDRKLSHYSDDRDAIQRRKELLLNVIDYQTDVNALLEGTDSKDKIEKGEWYFGEIEDEDAVISARLAKVKEDTRRKPDDAIEGFRKESDIDSEIAFFVIDLKETVMAYEFVGNIGKKAPYRILQDAFNAYYEGEEEISASPLVDKHEVRREIDELDYITEVQFSNLRPTNPDHTPTSKPMDDFLEESSISHLHLRGISDQRRRNPQGINITGSPLLDGGLNLAEEGYGSGTIRGRLSSGEKKEIKTGDIPIETEEDLGENDTVNRKRLLEEIRDALEQLDD